MKQYIFEKATKKKAKLRLALIGPTGSGKTYTALNIAQHLGSNIALIDTERGSASKFADLFDFAVVELNNFHPQNYIDAIHQCEAQGFDVLIIDSLSHAWMGKDGVLQLVEEAAKQSQSFNKFAAWNKVNPLQNALIDSILESKIHIITTLRAKMEYVMERDEQKNTISVRKVGLQPVQRDMVEYEFDVIGDLDIDNNLIIGKSRCIPLQGKTINKAGQEVADILKDWLTAGVAEKEVNCSTCGEAIRGQMVGDQYFSKQMLIDSSTNQFGKPLCLDCGKKRAKAIKATQAEELAKESAAKQSESETKSETENEPNPQSDKPQTAPEPVEPSPTSEPSPPPSQPLPVREDLRKQSATQQAATQVSTQTTTKQATTNSKKTGGSK